MISPTVHELLRPAMFVNSILWFTLTTSIFIYGLVAYLVAQGSNGASEVPEALPMALFGVAILTGMASVSVPRVLLSDERLRGIMRREPSPESLAQNQKLGTVDQERLRKIQSLSNMDRKLLQLPSLYFTPFILRMVLNEAIAIYGLVLAFLSHSFTPLLPFAVAAIALNLSCRPRIEPLLERAARLAY